MCKLLASCTAMASLFVSITKIASGIPFIFFIPPNVKSNFSFCLSIFNLSFLVRLLISPDSILSSKFLSFFIDFDTVSQFVNIPPNHLWFTKYWPQLTAACATNSEAERLVPTNKKIPPFLAIVWIASSASYNIGTVFSKFIICILFLLPKM